MDRETATAGDVAPNGDGDGFPGPDNPFRCLIEFSIDGFLLYDTQGLVHDVNQSAADLHGQSRDAIVGQRVSRLFESEDGDPELTDVDEEVCRKPRTVNAKGRRADGSTYPAEMRVGSVGGGPEGPFFALVRDVTEREESKERISFLSTHDELTGLPNCSFFTREVAAAIDRAERSETEVAVLHVDLNRFGLVNQALGSAGGDELLRLTGSRLREGVGAMDMVARYSADEFLVLVADARETEATAERIHELLRQPFDVDGTELFVDAAIGVSIYPLDADGASMMLQHADAAAQQAKRPGESPTKVFAGETSDKWARLWLATRLRKAIEQEKLELHYQPIVDLGLVNGSNDLGRSLIAVEALVRWREEDGSLVPPDGFIPVAEDLGLINSIGDWVVGEAADQAVRWKEEGSDVDISFNLSLNELWQPGLPERIHGQVLDAGLEPGNFTAEVTESTAMTDPVRTQNVLGDLKERGFHIAMDDFGAGHSSLVRLSQLPCEILKIDRSFISRLPDDPSARAMVTAMIELARGLGMRALAEGIETQGQLDFLRERGCEIGQGFLFSKPVPPSEIASL